MPLIEVQCGNWGIGGHALGLSDVRALQEADAASTDTGDGG